MDPTIKYLTDLGHQYNPMFGREYANANWEAVTLRDSAGVDLVRSFQMFMFPEHEENIRLQYGDSAEPTYDGEIGAATQLTLDTPRCGCPDYVQTGTGRGSWATGCTTEWPDNHAYYYHFDKSRMPSKVREWLPDMTKMVFGAYNELGFSFVETQNKQQANSLWYWTNLRSGIIGLASVPGAQGAANCQRGYFMSMDTGYASSVTMNSTLWAHEIGHNMRSGHISGDPIMHPGIRPGWTGTFKGTTFGNRLASWFGGEPNIPDEPDPPVDPPVDPPPGGDPYQNSIWHFEDDSGLRGPYELKIKGK